MTTSATPASSAAQLELMPPLLTKSRAAWAAGVSEGQIDKLTRDGLFPSFVMLSQSRRWRTAELLAWTDAGCPPMSEWQWPVPGDPEGEAHVDEGE